MNTSVRRGQTYTHIQYTETHARNTAIAGFFLVYSFVGLDSLFSIWSVYTLAQVVVPTGNIAICGVYILAGIVITGMYQMLIRAGQFKKSTHLGTNASIRSNRSIMKNLAQIEQDIRDGKWVNVGFRLAWLTAWGWAIGTNMWGMIFKWGWHFISQGTFGSWILAVALFALSFALPYVGSTCEFIVHQLWEHYKQICAQNDEIYRITP